MKFLVIRHGPTELNKTGRTNGQTIDDHLSEEGKEQAEKLSRMLPKDIDMMYVSDLSRARETAEIVNNVLGIPMVLAPELREIDLGELTGMTWREMAEKYGEDIGGEYRSQAYDFHRFGGESVADVKNRVLRLLSTIATREHGKKILLVTHAGIIRLLQYALKDQLHEKTEHSIIHEFEYDPDRAASMGHES
jgi:broad specificity phosphatase PhoE